MKVRLNILKVKSIELEQLEQGKKVIYWCDELPCFGVKRTRTTTSYIVQTRAGKAGKSVTHFIGKTQEISFHDAKSQAMKALASIRSGNDLNAEIAAQQERSEAQSLTLGQVFADYISEQTLRPRTLSLYQALVRLYLSDWKDKPIVSISRDSIQKRLQTLVNEPGTRGDRTAQAAQCYRLLHALFEFAIQKQDYEVDGKPILEVNPAKNKGKRKKTWNKTQVRDGIVHEDDLASWYSSLVKIKNLVLRDAILFTMFSGMRRSEVLTLTWQEVDFRRNKVTVRAEIAKTGKKREIPLTDVLLSILKSRHNARTLTNNHVFPGMNQGQSLVEPRRAINAVRKEMREKGIESSWTLHDLRRSYITHSTLLIPYPALKELVGHSMGNKDITEKHYVRLDLESLRPEAQIIANWLKEKMGINNDSLLVAAKR